MGRDVEPNYFKALVRRKTGGGVKKEKKEMFWGLGEMRQEEASFRNQCAYWCALVTSG